MFNSIMLSYFFIVCPSNISVKFIILVKAQMEPVSAITDFTGCSHARKKMGWEGRKKRRKIRGEKITPTGLEP